MSSLNGASYHLTRITQILDEAEPISWQDPDFDNGKFLSGREVNEVLWHLRSFFWKLVGAFDMMLQWVNEYFELGLAEDDVSWRRIRNAQSRTNPAWLETRQILSETWDIAWYFDVRTYRNFSHRSFLHPQTLIPREPGKIIVAMEAACDNAPMRADIREELPKYTEAMRLLGGRVSSRKGTPTRRANHFIQAQG
jgi:hypothetical protein